jgi:hypothetical protein
MIFRWLKENQRKAISVVEQKPEEQALLITLSGPIHDIQDIHTIEDELITAMTSSTVGEVDGHDFATDGSSATIYLYGPDADKLLLAASPVLMKFEIARGARLTRRYGSAENSESKEVISTL